MTEVAALARDEKSRPTCTEWVEGSLSAVTSHANRLSARADQREELIGCNENCSRLTEQLWLKMRRWQNNERLMSVCLFFVADGEEDC